MTAALRDSGFRSVHAGRSQLTTPVIQLLKLALRAVASGVVTALDVEEFVPTESNAATTKDEIPVAATQSYLDLRTPPNAYWMTIDDGDRDVVRN